MADHRIPKTTVPMFHLSSTILGDAVSRVRILLTPAVGAGAGDFFDPARRRRRES